MNAAYVVQAVAAVVALDFLPIGQSVLKSAFYHFTDHIGTFAQAADDPNRTFGVFHHAVVSCMNFQLD
jgi:4-hydroxy-L-threonine phosphate dehydrogenase PdxA